LLNSDGEPDMTALVADTLEAKPIAAQVEPEFCRWDGCMLDSAIVLDFGVLELGFNNHMARERDTWLDEAGEPRLPNVSSQRLEC